MRFPSRTEADPADQILKPRVFAPFQVGSTLRKLNFLGHSKDRGVMQGRWEGKELRQATNGRLLFTSEQGEVLRRNVLAGTKQHEVLLIPSLEH